MNNFLSWSTYFKGQSGKTKHDFILGLFQTEAEKALQDRLTKLVTILGGETTIDLHLQFLIRNNKTDMLILKNTKVRTIDRGTPNGHKSCLTKLVTIVCGETSVSLIS